MSAETLWRRLQTTLLSLGFAEGNGYTAIDGASNPEVRKALWSISQERTYPQVFVHRGSSVDYIGNGEAVIDICERQMQPLGLLPVTGQILAATELGRVNDGFNGMLQILSSGRRTQHHWYDSHRVLPAQGMEAATTKTGGWIYRYKHSKSRAVQQPRATSSACKLRQPCFRMTAACAIHHFKSCSGGRCHHGAAGLSRERRGWVAGCGDGADARVIRLPGVGPWGGVSG